MRERVGGVSMKESPVVALTPNASSHCESLCPLRLISALLLLMLLFSRKFGMLRREREKDREREKEIVCATSHWHKYLFATR